MISESFQLCIVIHFSIEKIKGGRVFYTGTLSPYSIGFNSYVYHFFNLSPFIVKHFFFMVKEKY